MRLLDLFCKAGGATKGYQRAGFEVIGVDIEPQPNYCGDEFMQADALHVLGLLNTNRLYFGHLAAVHASPPCPRYMRSGNVDRSKHPDLLPPTRELLERSGLPYVIENVPGAPMRPDIILCGSQFGLKIRRHRWFESNVSLPPWTLACNHSTPITGVYGHPHGKDGAWKGMLPSDHETWSREMGIDWMTTTELADAIPPAYTEHIGCQLLAAVTA